MIRRTCISVAAALTLIASAPRDAQAICGGSSFATCATVGIVKALLPNGQVQLIVAVANLSGLGGSTATSFTSIGLWGLPTSAQYVNGSLFVLGPNASSWSLGNGGLGGYGIANHVLGVQSSGGGLGAFGAAIFGFRLKNVSLSQINVHNWAIYGTSGSGCGTTLVATGRNANSPSVNCAPQPSPNVTPEPASLILLATGLAGLGGVGLRRRRRA